MDRTKPHPGFPFPKRKTKHRFVRLRALTAGGALAETRQRLVSVGMVRVSNCLKLVKTEKRHHGCKDDIRPHPGQTHSLTRPAATLSHPMGEGKKGESFAAPLKIYTTGLAGHSSAKPVTIESYFLSWGRG
jgi:hypothetical protein